MSFIASGSGLTAALTAALTSAGLGGTAAGIGGAALANGLVGAGLGAGGSALMGGDPGQGALIGGLGGAAGGALAGPASGSAGAATGIGSNASAQLASQITPAMTNSVGTSANAIGSGMGQLASKGMSAITPALSSVPKMAQSAQLLPGMTHSANVMAPALSNLPTLASGVATPESISPGLLSTLGDKLSSKGPELMLRGGAMMADNGQQPQPMMAPQPQPIQRRPSYQQMQYRPRGRI